MQSGCFCEWSALKSTPLFSLSTHAPPTPPKTASGREPRGRGGGQRAHDDVILYEEGGGRAKRSPCLMPDSARGFPGHVRKSITVITGKHKHHESPPIRKTRGCSRRVRRRRAVSSRDANDSSDPASETTHLFLSAGKIALARLKVAGHVRRRS